MDERRYGESEIREIFGAATRSQDLAPPAPTEHAGLTLQELLGIGREIGVDPERIVEAAAALDAPRGALPRRTRWGMPVGVGRTVELSRAPTDREWETLVGELRHTFGARGEVDSHGGLREWSNGNLHACVEPTEGGYRLRMGTVKGSASAFNQLGIAGLAMSLLTLLALSVSGRLPEALFVPLVFAAMGGGALAGNWIGLPRWAEERERQMAHIAERAVALIGSGDGGPEAEPE